jgi:hypothetical protein
VSAVVGTWSRGVPSWPEDHSIPSNSKVLGRKRRWRGEDLVGPSKFVGTLYLPSSSLACIIPFDRSILVGRAAAGGGQLLLGGIQLGTDVEIVASCPQRTTRLLSLWEVGLLVGILLGLSGGQREVVVHGTCEGLSGGFSSGRALQNPGLGSQAEGEGLVSRRTLVM